MTFTVVISSLDLPETATTVPRPVPAWGQREKMQFLPSTGSPCNARQTKGQTKGSKVLSG